MAAPSRTQSKKPWYSVFSLELLFVFLLLFAMIIFIYAVRMVFINQDSGFDQRVFNGVKPYINSGTTRFMEFITFLGKHTLLIPLNFVLIAFFIYKKQKWFAIRIASLSLSSLLLMLVLKLYFQRDRPLFPVLGEAKGFSFPSGHALISVVFYGLLIHAIWHEVKTRWLRNLLAIFFGILILLIAFSRIYLRVHYASDVIAGLAAGFIWLVLSLSMIQRIEKRFIARRALKAEHLE